MDVHLDALARELTALTQRFVDLGATLGDAARALEEAGAPPADTLVEDLAGARTQFIRLCTDVLSAADGASVPTSGPPESLTELEPLLGAIGEAIRTQARRAALEEMRQGVLATLDQVLEIVHRDDPAFATLLRCRDKARALRDSALGLTDPDAPEVRELPASTQPFTDLLTMVESREALDDERYGQLEESVSRNFGRSLAVAVARGRLGFRGDIPEPPPAPALEPAPEPALEPPPEPIATAPLAETEPVPALPTLEMPLELETTSPPVPEPVTFVLEPTIEMPVVEMPVVEMPVVEMPSIPLPTIEMPPIEAPPEMPAIELPPLELESREPMAPPPAPEPEPEPEPVVAAAPVPASPAEAPLESAPDETAQWWLAAWARWSGWKSTHDFATVVREEIGKYPYLLSVPIQKSPEYEDGLLAYGYSILMDHVEKQKPGCVGNALNSLKAGQNRPVGAQLYEYLVAEGRLEESYPEFVKNAVLAAVPDPGLWFQFRILESKEDTRIFQRPSARLGDAELSGQRLASDAQRYAEHKFTMTLPPLTTRFLQVSADIIKDARGVGVKIAGAGTACDSGWIVSVPAGARGKPEARRVVEDGTHVPGLGKDFAALWIAVFNPDPGADRRYELSVFLRKDTKSPFRGKG